jgi:hypothetical protein
MRRKSCIAALVLGLCAIGQTGVSAATSGLVLAKAAAQAVQGASSVRMAGTLNASGIQQIDIVIFHNGDLSGSFVTKNGTVRIEQVKKTDYFKADATYWNKVGGIPAQIAKLMAPEWISMPSSSGGLGDSLSAKALTSDWTSEKHVTIVGHKQIDHRPAIGLNDGQSGDLWVEASAPHRPIVLQQSSGGHGSVTFSGWNSFKDPVAPKGAVPLSSFH